MVSLPDVDFAVGFLHQGRGGGLGQMELTPVDTDSIRFREVLEAFELKGRAVRGVSQCSTAVQQHQAGGLDSVDNSSVSNLDVLRRVNALRAVLLRLGAAPPKTAPPAAAPRADNVRVLRSVNILRFALLNVT